jgi:hypothetical protein
MPQERIHIHDHVVVLRIRIGNARLQPYVGGDHGGPGRGRNRQIVGIAETADVVAHDGARSVRRIGNGCPPGVDGDREVEPLVQRRDRRDHSIQFLLLTDVWPGTGLDTTDVQEVRAIGDELIGPAVEGIEIPELALVVERVGRAVEDAHHEGAVGDVEAVRSERHFHRRDPTDHHNTARPVIAIACDARTYPSGSDEPQRAVAASHHVSAPVGM